MPVSEGAEVASSPLLRIADELQAEYFLQALDAEKSEVWELLETRLDELAGFQRAGDLAGVRHHRRTIKELESELRRVDRMLLALRVRLGLPTLRRTL